MPDRYLDLLKQGIWKPRREKPKKKAVVPIVACYDCGDWHPKGRHIRTKEERAQRRAERDMLNHKDKLKGGIDDERLLDRD